MDYSRLRLLHLSRLPIGQYSRWTASRGTGLLSAIDFKMCPTRTCEPSSRVVSALHSVAITDLCNKIVLYASLFTMCKSAKNWVSIGPNRDSRIHRIQFHTFRPNLTIDSKLIDKCCVWIEEDFSRRDSLSLPPPISLTLAGGIPVAVSIGFCSRFISV